MHCSLTNVWHVFLTEYFIVLPVCKIYGVMITWKQIVILKLLNKLEAHSNGSYIFGCLGYLSEYGPHVPASKVWTRCKRYHDSCRWHFCQHYFIMFLSEWDGNYDSFKETCKYSFITEFNVCEIKLKIKKICCGDSGLLADW